MGKTSIWLLVLSITAACTCGGRTECSKKGQITFLLSVHDDASCEKVLNKGVMLFEAAKYLAEQHNNKSNYKLELSVLDTCGSITGTLKAAMKALVWSDTNCLRPPNYLGIIGPEATANIDAVQKITSTLNIPHIVKTATVGPYVHHLSRESDSFIVQGVLEVIEALKWKSFTLMSSINHENDIQHIAKKITAGATARGLCVAIYDSDFDDSIPHIVYIGKPSEKILKIQNSTILIASEGNLDKYLNKYTSNSNVLLLEDTRNEFNGLEIKVETSKWWNNNEGVGKYDREELRDIRWLEDAIKIYAKTFEALCAKKQCYGQVNPTEWNNMIATTITTHNAQLSSTTRILDLSIMKYNRFAKLGQVKVRKNHAKIQWNIPNDNDNNNSKFDDVKKNNNDDNDDDENDENNTLDSADELIPKSFKKLISKGKDITVGCAKTTSVDKASTSEDDDDDDEDDIAKVFFDNVDEEWWSMVVTVGGIGISMFTIGILAVYVVVTNIKVPKTPKSKKRQIVRDLSLRRVESDNELQVSVTRPQRPRRDNPRKERESIRSIQSDRSV